MSLRANYDFVLKEKPRFCNPIVKLAISIDDSWLLVTMKLMFSVSISLRELS